MSQNGNGDSGTSVLEALWRGSANPIHFHEGAWWYWDAFWATRIGPFVSVDEAAVGLKAAREQQQNRGSAVQGPV